MKSKIDSTHAFTNGEVLFRTAYGETLRMWRARHGKFKQMALARKAGLPDHAVGGLERGERPVVFEEMVGICEALEVEVHVFLEEVQKRAFQPLAESLRARGGASVEEMTTLDFVCRRAEALISSLSELARSRGAATGR